MREKDRKRPDRLAAAIRNAHAIGPTWTDVARALQGSVGFLHSSKPRGATDAFRDRLLALGVGERARFTWRELRPATAVAIRGRVYDLARERRIRFETSWQADGMFEVRRAA